MKRGNGRYCIRGFVDKSTLGTQVLFRCLTKTDIDASKISRWSPKKTKMGKFIEKVNNSRKTHNSILVKEQTKKLERVI